MNLNNILMAANEYIDGINSFQNISLTTLSKKYGCKREKIAEQVKQLGFSIINRTSGKIFDNHIFDVIDTEEKAYWLGFLYADGCVTNNSVELSVHIKDRNHLIKYSNFLKLNSDYIKDVENISRVRVHNKHLSESLESKGCVKQKSLKLTFPKFNIFSKQSLIYDFIRGYFDGDGCIRIYKHKKGATVCDIDFVGTKNFLEGIRDFLGVKGGIIRSASSKNNKTSVYRLDYRCVSARKVSRLLYENSSIWLLRKYEEFKKFCRFEEESSIVKSSKISRRCDANTEVSSGIAKGSETPQRVESE